VTTQVDTTDKKSLNEFGKWRQDNGVEAEIIPNTVHMSRTFNLENIKDSNGNQSIKNREEIKIYR
jgi:hypothetical protein